MNLKGSHGGVSRGDGRSAIAASSSADPTEFSDLGSNSNSILKAVREVLALGPGLTCRLQQKSAGLGHVNKMSRFII